MRFSDSDLENLTDEFEDYDGVEVMTNSITSNSITFATEDWIYDVTFEMEVTEVNVTKITKRNEHDREELRVPMSLKSGNYDELIAELLFFLDIIDEDNRDFVVYGRTFS